MTTRPGILLLLTIGFVVWSGVFVGLYAGLSVGCAAGWHLISVGPVSLLRVLLIIGLVVFGVVASRLPGLSQDGAIFFASLIALPALTATVWLALPLARTQEWPLLGAAALAAGGSEADGAEDYGFMYSRSFFDLDGHGWQVMWMDPAAVEQGPEAFAAAPQDADAPA